MAFMLESDLTDLKLKELLNEVRVDYSKTQALEDALTIIRDILLNISEEQIKTTGAAAFIKDLGVPDDKVNFKFRKPDSVEIIGSYAIKVVAKPVENVDLAVRMPKACFHEKDYLNHRYHAKRCLYLSVIKKHLDSCSAVRKIEWSTFRDDARKPILVIHPGGMEDSTLTGFVIRIIPTILAGVFDVSRLAPSRNNVRVFQQGGTAQATPYYNASILEDIFLEDHSAFLQKSLSCSNALGEALLLLKIWARQRSSISAPDCLNGFLASMILAHLTTEAGGQRINSLMTGLQIFRVVIDFFANSNNLEKGIFMKSKSVGIMPLEQKKEFLKSFDIVIYDSIGHLNLAFRMTKSALAELRDEATRTLLSMYKCKDKGFEELFLTRIDFATKFDYYVRIHPMGSDHLNWPQHCMDEESWRVYEKKVELLLHKGLGERARLIRVISRSMPGNWNLSEGLASIGKIPILVGILISDFEKAFRMLDMGPSADNKEESTKFRTFWGEKAELRRFKDGTIAESAVWECEQWEKHLIIKKIAEYILSRHLSLSTQDICIVADQLDFSLMEGGKDSSISSSNLLEAFDVLSKRLRGLKDLPLNISSVQPLDSGLSHGTLIGNVQNGNTTPPEKDLLLRSQHSSMLNGLHGVHPVYGPTVRLAKRWICSHLFSAVLADEAVELLVAYLFVRPFPFSAPQSQVTGFLRFLRLIANYDWAMSPLIVDVNGDLTVKDQDQIMSQFIANRKGSEEETGAANGGPAMYIATPYDRESQSWTSFFPDKLGHKRLIAYARSSSELLTHLIGGEIHDRWESLFRTPLHCYDALIVLHRDKLAYPNQMLFAADIKQGNAAPPVVTGNASKDFCPYLSPLVFQRGFHEARNHVLVGFDPVKYFLHDLKVNFPKYFDIWYDALGNEVMGLTWTREASFSKDAGHKRKRDELDSSCFDVRCILKEIGDVGEGLVKSLHLLNIPKDNK